MVSDDQNPVVAPGIDVPLSTLALLLPKVAIRLLEIDVEGFELFVLRGAQSVLERTLMMYFESWEEHFRKYGYGTSDVLSLLRDHGFEIGVPENYRSDRNENLLRAHKLVLDTASFTMGASSPQIGLRITASRQEERNRIAWKLYMADEAWADNGTQLGAAAVTTSRPLAFDS